MPDYLLEIGTEELPADQVTASQAYLKSKMAEALAQNNLPYSEIFTYGTPRRIACIVKQLAQIQSTTYKKVKGPPVKSSFDKDGKPLPSLIGFAQKQGISQDKLEKEDIGGVTYLIANLTIEGKSVQSVLSSIVPSIISQISGDRLMRWGTSDFKFSRPIRWLVSLLDENEVKISLNNVISGNETFGHRILKPGKHKIKSAKTYIDDLKNLCVLVRAEDRKNEIIKQAQGLASNISGKLRKLNDSLLDEVINITEWPCAILGEFEKEYLDLPDVLIETIMVHHQKYFPVESVNNDKLLPYFVSIANNNRDSAKSAIKQGNERVLKARLADGRFFYFDDQKTKLSNRKNSLSQLTFHEGMGSYLEKQERLESIAQEMTKALKLESHASALIKTLSLCKLDLVTNLVRELPELQGYVGSWYAKLEGEPNEVSYAIASHYAPRSTSDNIPNDLIGSLASILDKLDNLVCLFALGKKPSGSSDPYMLRRQAQGLVDIVMADSFDKKINLSWLITKLLDLLKPKLDTFKTKITDQVLQTRIVDLKDFLLQRVKTKLTELGAKREIMEAVLAIGDPLVDLKDVIIRIKSLEEFIQSNGGLDLVRAGVRVGNILNSESSTNLNPERLKEPSEKELFEQFTKIVTSEWKKETKPDSKEEYLKLLTLLKKIAPTVDNFFENVMVNDPDIEKRNNRHALLKNVDYYFKLCADFPKLQPLIL